MLLKVFHSVDQCLYNKATNLVKHKVDKLGMKSIVSSRKLKIIVHLNQKYKINILNILMVLV